MASLHSRLSSCQTTASASLKALPKTLKLKKGKLSVTLGCAAGPACSGNLTVTQPGKGERKPTVSGEEEILDRRRQTDHRQGPADEKGKAATNGRSSLAATLTVKLNGVAKPLSRKVTVSR